MKIKLTVYKYVVGTLERDFACFEHARRTAELAAEKHPDMLFEPEVEPEVEVSDACVIDLSDLGKDDIQEVNPWYNVSRV
jgi:hypothetical protein